MEKIFFVQPGNNALWNLIVFPCLFWMLASSNLFKQDYLTTVFFSFLISQETMKMMK